MRDPLDVGLPGPLAPYGPGCGEYLAGRGYRQKDSAVAHLRLMVDVDGWLDDQGLELSALATSRVEEFVMVRRRRDPRSPRTLRVLLGYLATQGVLDQPAGTALEALLEDYCRYLVAERSLAEVTVRNYMSTAERFLSELSGDEAAVARLTASEVTGFVLRVGRGLSPTTVNSVVVRLRSLLRFLFVKGMIEAPLANALPWMATHQDSSVPRAIPGDQVAAILASCDRDTVSGARDFAMVMLMARLALRAGEVAALELGDIDWRSGEIMVRGKGASRERLPLPVDVGEALVSYLGHRGPGRSCRQVFVQVIAPHEGVSMTVVRAAVRAACQRAGLADTGTHRFRHRVATDMLASGTPMHEIGQLLRYGALWTTAIYAKVDRAALMAVAEPWPGSPA